MLWLRGEVDATEQADLQIALLGGSRVDVTGVVDPTRSSSATFVSWEFRAGEEAKRGVGTVLFEHLFRLQRSPRPASGAVIHR